MDNYLLVDASSMTQAQIQDECNNQSKNSYLLNQVATVGAKVYLIFVRASLMR